MKHTVLIALLACTSTRHADTLRAPATLPVQGTIRMNATPVPLVPLSASPPPSESATLTGKALPERATTAPAALRPDDAQKIHYAGPPDEQLARLRRKVEDLERRLAQAETRLAEHRHAYTTPGINQLNYRTVKMLLDHADDRDGLLSFPGGTSYRETGPAK